MYLRLTPYLRGKLDGLARRRRKCPYEKGSQTADEYEAGYLRGRSFP